MRTIGAATAIVTILLNQGCSKWPPGSPSRSPIEGFEQSSSIEFDDWTHIYESKEGSEIPNPIGMAYLIKEGDFEIPFNLFKIEKPGRSYVESQFEVLYVGDRMTQIRATEAEGDRIALIEESTGSMSYGFTNPGARIRCGEAEYELRADGWYQDGALIHAFK